MTAVVLPSLQMTEPLRYFQLEELFGKLGEEFLVAFDDTSVFYRGGHDGSDAPTVYRTVHVI